MDNPCMTRLDLNLRFTTREVSTLPITPQMMFIYKYYLAICNLKYVYLIILSVVKKKRIVTFRTFVDRYSVVWLYKMNNK